MTVKEAANVTKLLHTALTNWSSEPLSSHSEGNECSRSGSHLDTEEEDLLQELVTVPSAQSQKDAGTQVEQSSTQSSDKNDSERKQLKYMNCSSPKMTNN